MTGYDFAVNNNCTYTNNISVEDYNKLSDAVGWGVIKPERVAYALKRSDFIVAAHLDGQAIGMARVMQDGLQAHIMDVMVLPDYQKRGIGYSLMEYVMQYINNLSQNGGIFVSLMSALGKDGFYEKFGLESRPTDKSGPGMSLWIEK